MSKIDEYLEAKAISNLVKCFFGDSKLEKNIKLNLRQADAPQDSTVRATVEVEITGMPVLRLTGKTAMEQQEKGIKVVLPFLLGAVESELTSLLNRAVELAASKTEIARMDAEDEAKEVLQQTSC
jgi:hypothetical protein